MKKIIFSFCVLFFLSLTVNVFAQDNKNLSRKEKKELEKKNKVKADSLASLPEMTFKVSSHDFGTMKQGANGTFEFVFINTGKKPLLITNCQPSCGCTVPTWSKEPILGGKESKITVTYDTQRLGSFHKTVTITSNAKNSPVVLTIQGTIEAK